MKINRQILADFLELSKIRMVPMVLITATYGYFLGGQDFSDPVRYLCVLLAFSLVSIGSATLNNYLEREVDAKMHRTCQRVLPTGRVSAFAALIYGISMVLSGVFLLVWRVNLLTGFLMLIASFLYVLVYTPMKRWTTWNTFVGAIPGAIPPLAGWTAATGQIDLGGILLFLILFTWQHPHFYAIAFMHREDYSRGGFKMLPVVDETGKRTFRQIIVYLLLLLLVSLLPSAIGMTGRFYLYGTAIAGLYFLIAGVNLCIKNDLPMQRRLFFASLIYLPSLLLLMVADFGLRYFY